MEAAEIVTYGAADQGTDEGKTGCGPEGWTGDVREGVEIDIVEGVEGKVDNYKTDCDYSGVEWSQG